MKNYLLPLLLLFVISTSLCHAQIFYGMTFKGGADTVYGTIISFNASTNKENVVSNFAEGTGPQNPLGNLTYDSKNGLFYGMTSSGGTYDRGTIIRLNPSTNKDSVVWDFADDTLDGGIPSGSLVYDTSNGLFYGMTSGGGKSIATVSGGGGVIFSFNPNGNVETVLWKFSGTPSDGAAPIGNLIFDQANVLFYGMTSYGGSSVTNNNIAGNGVLFSFDPATNKDSVLWNFGNGTDGSGPLGSLIYDADNGLFYGTTSYGGNDTSVDNSYGEGTIISFNPINNSENVVWNFGKGTDGAVPYGDLLQYTGNGLLYAMTTVGGSNNDGTIISFDPTGNAESVVWNFGNGTDGKTPDGGLVYNSSNGLFYGMTAKGGTNDTVKKGYGTIFSFNPTGSSENVLWNFGSGTDGILPYGNLVLYPPSAGAGINQLKVESGQLTVYPNPSNDFIHAAIQLKQTSDLQLRLVNMLGQTVWVTDAGTVSNYQNNIAVADLPDGIYLLEMVTGSGTESKQIVVTH